MTVRQDRQTRRPPLTGSGSVRGAEGSDGFKPFVPEAGMMLNDTCL